MGSLKYPFVGAVAAILMAALLLAPHVFWQWAGPMQLILGLTLGVLASVMLYAVMRSISTR